RFRARTRSMDTFQAVYEAYFELVWRFAASRGVAREALDEVVTKVFVTVRGRLPGFEDPAMLRASIAGITRNVVRAPLRKQGPESPFEPVEEDESRDTAHDPVPAEALTSRTSAELVDVILEHMSEPEREVFILCEMEGLAPEETAWALRISERTLE